MGMGSARSRRLSRDLRIWGYEPPRAPVIWWVLFFLLCSCSPDYVIRAAYEEGKILWRRKPIAEALRTEDLDPGLRAKFKTVLGVRAFAKEELALRVGGSYASYSHVDGPVLSYLLTAVPKTDFQPYTWWFLFVGSVPYKGYFDREDAEQVAQKLEATGHGIGPLDVLRVMGTDPRGPAQNQRGQPLRTFDQQTRSHQPAERVSEDVSTSHAEVIQESDHVGGHASAVCLRIARRR